MSSGLRLGHCYRCRGVLWSTDWWLTRLLTSATTAELVILVLVLLLGPSAWACVALPDAAPQTYSVLATGHHRLICYSLCYDRGVVRLGPNGHSIMFPLFIFHSTT